MHTVEIPVSFEYKGYVHKGFLCSPGGNVWFLTVHMQYWGTLSLTKEEWRFQGDEGLSDLTDYFADVVVAWYE